MSAVAVVLLTLLVVLIALGVPIAFALALASLGAILVQGQIPLLAVPQRLFTSTDSFALLAVPFFILAGEIMQQGGISRRLVAFANDLLGWVSGGLALVSIAACAFFAAISGSGAATTAAIGGVMYPEMKKRGYHPDFAAAVQALGGTLGIVIPPSIPFVVYGIITGASVGALFLAGVIPGMLGALAYMFLAFALSRRAGYRSGELAGLGQLWHSFREAFWGLLMPLIILGGIYGGVFTPTEAAVVAVVYALAVALFIYREIGLKDLKRIFVGASITSAMVMFLIATAALFGWVMTRENIPQQLARAIVAVAGTPLTFLLLVNVIYFVAGMLLDTVAIILLLVPILYPIAAQLGIDPVHFGLVTVFNLGIGQITPPFGVCLFVSSGISGISLERIARAIWPFFILAVLLTLLYTYVPSLSLWLPAFLKG
ncbi:MAG: C4-dicarboxylate transporter, DctM subunit [Bacillota bacterium]|jgi:C4-dicarboxylate transporter DctM subunit|nr:C4-dicarboxylate transporter, DctM subunit [Bacillota bacterium]